MANRAGADSIHKNITKNITKQFLTDTIHALITDGKIINKKNGWRRFTLYK